MPLKKDLFLEKYREFSEMRKILLKVVINKLKDMLFENKKKYRYYFRVPKELKKYYTEQRVPIHQFLITYPYQEDQEGMIKFLEEIGVISGVKTRLLPGILKTSTFKIDKEALLELEEVIHHPLAKKNDTIAYEIEKNEKGIFLKGCSKPISSPRYGEINHQVFEIVFQNPKKEISRKEVDLHLKKGIHFPKGTEKDFGEVFRELGFKGELREIFVKVTKNSIYFRSPVLMSDLKKMNIEYIPPEELISEKI